MMGNSKFRVTVHDTAVDVEHKTEGHHYSFEREPGNALGVVAVTPNHASEVFASSLEEEARSAAKEALLSQTSKR
jgi:hypothetical protein